MSRRPLFYVKKRALLAVAGLGCALALAGVLFAAMFFRYESAPSAGGGQECRK